MGETLSAPQDNRVEDQELDQEMANIAKPDMDSYVENVARAEELREMPNQGVSLSTIEEQAQGYEQGAAQDIEDADRAMDELQKKREDEARSAVREAIDEDQELSVH